MNNNQGEFKTRAYSLSDQGRRPNNEDYVTFFEPKDSQERRDSGCIYIVADGVGGASVGERASKHAAEKVLYEYLEHPEIEPGARLKRAITLANREIFEYAEDRGIRMATTLTAAVVIGNSLIAANVGDSRVYLIHGNNVQQITRDHNIVGELMRDGEMTEAEALKSKAKNKLTRSIGGDAEVHVDLFGPIPLQPGDKIMLCSDGLTRYTVQDDISNLTATGSSKEITENLMAFAKKRGRGGADNISIVTVEYEPSADTGATVVRIKPSPPVQAWEVRETELPRLPFFRVIPWLAFGAGLVFVIGFTYAYLGGWFTTRIDAKATVSDIPEAISQVAEMGGESTAPPTETSTSTSGTPIEGPIGSLISASIDCSTFKDRPYMRSEPYVAEETYLGVLTCDQEIALTGYIPEYKGYDWYQFKYTDPDGNLHYAWVVAFRVNVDSNNIKSLPQMDSSGNIISVTPSSIIESEPKPICIYTVQEDDTLAGIAVNFEISAAGWQDIRCSTASPDCRLPNENSLIVTGWRVVIPGVNSDNCILKGGEWAIN